MTQASQTQGRSWSECCGKPLEDSKTLRRLLPLSRPEMRWFTSGWWPWIWREVTVFWGEA